MAFTKEATDEDDDDAQENGRAVRERRKTLPPRRSRCIWKSLFFRLSRRRELRVEPLSPRPCPFYSSSACRQWLDTLYPTPYCRSSALPSSSCHHLPDAASRPSSQRTQQRYEHLHSTVSSQPHPPHQRRTLVLIPTSPANSDPSNPHYPTV